MTEEQLAMDRKLRNYLPMSAVADLLLVSRVTVHRSWRRFIGLEEGKINPYLEKYFDNVVNDRYADPVAAKEDLKRMRVSIEAGMEEDNRAYKEEWLRLEKERRAIRANTEMSEEERHEAILDVSKKIHDLKDLHPSANVNRLYGYSPEGLRWNRGAVRSLCVPGVNPVVIVDRDFEDLQGMTVEVSAKVEGVPVVIARYRFGSEKKYVILDNLEGMNCTYCIKIVGREEVVGPFPIRARIH